VKIGRALCDFGAIISLMHTLCFIGFTYDHYDLRPFSLQLVDGSKMRPLGKLEDVPVKIGDIWILEDFIIANTTETDEAQIILGRPFLAILGYNIDVKRGRLTFKVGGCYAMVYFMDERVASPISS